MTAEDYGVIAAAPSRVTIGGVDYRVSKLTARIRGELTQFLKSFVPDPRLKAREILAAIPPDAVALKDVALAIWREFSDEAKSWPPSLVSDEGIGYLTGTGEGAVQVVYSLLRRHSGEMTWEKATQLADEMTPQEVADLLVLSFPEADFRPKAPTMTTATADRGPVPR